MGKPLIVLGCGGHAKVLMDALLLNNETITKIIDPFAGPDLKKYRDIPVYGNEKELNKIDKSHYEIVIGLGSLPNKNKRHEIYNKLIADKFTIKTVVHPTTVVSSTAKISQGAQVMAGSIIQVDSFVGENTIINTKASLDHDAHIGSFCHIAPGVTLSGNVTIGNYCHVGTGAVIIQGVTIGNHCIIGAGAVVTKNLADNQIVYPVRATVMDRSWQ